MPEFAQRQHHFYLSLSLSLFQFVFTNILYLSHYVQKGYLHDHLIEKNFLKNFK